MYFCFDSRLPWDYSQKEMEFSKINGNGILYDEVLKTFMDFEGNNIDIKNKVLFNRTGCAQLYKMNDEIVKQGGIPVVSNEETAKIESWPVYYHTERKSKIIKGHDLIDTNTIKEIETLYGKELFIKTKSKNFSGIIPIELLVDKKCAFYKTLLHHLDDDFIISRKVNIKEDEYGKKEYRCFIVNNEIYNISRFTTSVLHPIDIKVLEKAQEIVEKQKEVFPGYYVLDLFEYQLDGEDYMDVVEFNPINSSGLYLYNSCLNKSNDILHSELENVSYEFIDNIEECTIDGKVFDDRSNLYDITNSFSNHLRSICVTGKIGMTWIHGIKILEKDFARHDAIFNLSSETELKEEPMIREQEDDIFQELLDSGLSSEQVEKAKMLLKTNKS